jgi:hypothetical protein
LVLCPYSPFGDSPIVIVQLATPLSPPPAGEDELLHPWGVELDDGSRCHFVSGAVGIHISGVSDRFNYACEDGVSWLPGVPLINTDGTWTILKVLLVKDPNTGSYVSEDADGNPFLLKASQVVRMRIRTAWY